MGKNFLDNHKKIWYCLRAVKNYEQNLRQIIF
jgi:hypothetical protein